jgi:hypothetical protein
VPSLLRYRRIAVAFVSMSPKPVSLGPRGFVVAFVILCNKHFSLRLVYDIFRQTLRLETGPKRGDQAPLKHATRLAPHAQ